MESTKRQFNKSTEYPSKTYQIDYGNTEPIISALETCQMEMEPIEEKVNKLRTKIRNLNLNLDETTSQQCQHRKRHSHTFAVKTIKPVVNMRPPSMYVPYGVLPFGIPQFRLTPGRCGVQIPDQSTTTPVVLLPGFTLPTPAATTATETIPSPSSLQPPDFPQSFKTTPAPSITPRNLIPLTTFPTPFPRNGVPSPSPSRDTNGTYSPPSLNATQRKVLPVNNQLIDALKPRVHQFGSLSPCTSSCCVLPSYLRHKMTPPPSAQSHNVPSTPPPSELVVPPHISKPRNGNLNILCKTTFMHDQSSRPNKVNSSADNYVSSLGGRSPTCKCPCNSSIWKDSKVESIIVERLDDLSKRISDGNAKGRKDGAANASKSKIKSYRHKGRYKERKQNDATACFCNVETTDTDQEM